MKNAHTASQKAKTAKSRTPRHSRGESDELPTFHFPDNDSGLLAFTSVVASIRASKCLKDVLSILDLTFEDFGRRLGQSPQFAKQRPDGFSKTYLSLIDHGRKPCSKRMSAAIGFVIGQVLSQMTGEIIGVHVSRNSPWKFRLAKRCEEHGPFELIGNRRHCPVCGK